MDRQKIIIYMLVGVMLFSVIGLGLILILDSGNNSSISDTAQIQEQLSAQEQVEQEAAQEAFAAAQCLSLPQDPTAQPLATPEVLVLEKDVSELQITEITEGSGEVVAADSCIVAHYHGTLASDGTVFDSSFERGQPARFPLTGVIEGWQQGLLGMKEGGVRRLVIPSELAYGEAGSPPVIDPDADLVFVVELVRIEQ